MRRSALVATLAIGLGLSPSAHAERINTWQGECTGVAPARSSYPEQRLSGVPASIRLVVRFEGGSCTGTMNGERVVDEPMRGSIDVYGPQACLVGAADGRGAFTIAGETITADAHYRRVGVTAFPYLDGDTSGRVQAVARPLMGGADFDAISKQCMEEGVSGLHVMVEKFDAPLGISSPVPTGSEKPERLRR